MQTTLRAAGVAPEAFLDLAADRGRWRALARVWGRKLGQQEYSPPSQREVCAFVQRLRDMTRRRRAPWCGADADTLAEPPARRRPDVPGPVDRPPLPPSPPPCAPPMAPLAPPPGPPAVPVDVRLSIGADGLVSFRLRPVTPPRRCTVGASVRAVPGGVALRLFTCRSGRRRLEGEYLLVLTGLLFCLADPLAQGVATAQEVLACCRDVPLGFSGQQLAAARRLSLVRVQHALADMAAAVDSPVRRATGGFTI